MKKFYGPLFCFLLVLTLLLGSFASARAAVGDDPVITPVSGDMEFTTEVVSIAALPGTIELASQMLAPVGFPTGEAQFGGNGIRVTSMDSGKANVCFTLSTVAVNQGWGGKGGVWNGTKWVLLPTAITTTSDEAASTTACATITGNGTYAFIQYVVDPAKLPTTGLPLCNFEVGGLISMTYGDPYMYLGITSPNTFPLPGTPFTWRVINANPADSVLGPHSGNAVIADNEVMDMFWTYEIGPYWSDEGSMTSLTLRLDFDHCYALLEINTYN